MPHKNLLVIGGGAAGIFCAVNAKRLNPSLQVMVLEKTGKLLSKVRISGGGRCNITHACFDADEMSRRYPRGRSFVRKAFHRFFTRDTIQWFEDRGVKLKTEADGRMFPVTDSSQTVIDCLLREAEKLGVKIRMKSEVCSVQLREAVFLVELADEQVFTADFLCIACGGYPKTGLFDWIVKTGHDIEEPVPSLFTFNMPGHPLTGLMGVSVPDTKVKIAGTKTEQRGPVLITHWGLSGPAILRLSAWGARELAAMQWQFAIRVNWLPEWNEQSLSSQFQSLRYDRAAQPVSGKNPFGLPQRLWEFFADASGIKEGTRWSDLPAKAQNRLIRHLCDSEFDIRGKTTFKEEFVTAGGIRLSQVDPNTMMSKRMPGLFFAGEVMDVDGITGGYNFQHAWTSGFIAGKSIAVLAQP